jgi:hypothetical protein
LACLIMARIRVTGLYPGNTGEVSVTSSVRCNPPAHAIVYAVEVTGNDPNRRFATGSGVALADPLEKIYSTYGHRLRLSKHLHGREITIQWKDATGAAPVS